MANCFVTQVAIISMNIKNATKLTDNEDYGDPLELSFCIDPTESGIFFDFYSTHQKHKNSKHRHTEGKKNKMLDSSYRKNEQNIIILMTIIFQANLAGLFSFPLLFPRLTTPLHSKRVLKYTVLFLLVSLLLFFFLLLLLLSYG